jgi:hypothetical protein
MDFFLDNATLMCNVQGFGYRFDFFLGGGGGGVKENIKRDLQIKFEI